MRLRLLVGVLGASAGLATTVADDARACGGCFAPRQSGTVVSDHRMIFSVSPTQTTLYDQITYSGAPASFAWVLPIHGQVTVGLSADLVFSALDQVTQTTIVAPPRCTPCFCGAAPGLAAGFGGGASGSSSGGGVTVITQQVVGPYQTVQLHPNSTSDTAALTDWLTANSYDITSDVAPVIGKYVSEGFDFLAMRLVPGQGVQAMRPVSVTSTGAALSLPLRMVAAGTGSTVGITLWVVGSGRYEPQNFQSFTILPADLVWDWSTNSSNYTTLRSQKEAAFSNAAWQIESSLDLSPYSVENQVLQDPMAAAYEAVPAADGGLGLTPPEVRSQDLATLFPAAGNSVRVTRMRSDLSHAALANDLVLQASADQSNLSNIYQTTVSINGQPCAPCNCGVGSSGGGPGSGGVSSSGGAGSSSGVGGSGSGGVAGGSSGGFVGGGPSDAGAGATGPSHEAFACAASPAEPVGSGWGLGLAGLLGAALVRARVRRKR